MVMFKVYGHGCGLWLWMLVWLLLIMVMVVGYDNGYDGCGYGYDIGL